MQEITKRVCKMDFCKSILSYQSDSEITIFSECNYFRADFVRAIISNKTYNQCNFDNADLSQASFINCTFHNCTFKHANCSKTKFSECVISSDDAISHITSLNYLDNESRFDKSSFTEATFSKSSFINIYIRAVGFKYATFESVTFDRFVTFSVSFESSKISNCTSDCINLTNCSCNQLSLGKNDFDKIIVSEAKLLTIIGIEDFIDIIEITQTNNSTHLPKIKVGDELISFIQSSYTHFSRNMQLFEQINASFILKKLNAIDLDKNKVRMKQIALLRNSDSTSNFENLIRITFEEYARKCIENNIPPTQSDITNSLILLDKHKLFDIQIYHSIMSVISYEGKGVGSDVSNALLMYQMLNYSRKIESKKFILKITMPNSNLDQIEDIEYLSRLFNMLSTIADVSNYENLQLIQGSLIKYLSFVEKSDLRKVLFVSFLLGSNFNISSESWEFSFNLKEIFISEENDNLEKFNSDITPHLNLGQVSVQESVLLENRIREHQQLINSLERDISVSLSTDSFKINDTNRIISLFSSNQYGLGNHLTDLQ